MRITRRKMTNVVRATLPMLRARETLRDSRGKSGRRRVPRSVRQFAQTEERASDNDITAPPNLAKSTSGRCFTCRVFEKT